MDTWIVTGGAGFIGSNFVRLALAKAEVRVVVLDKLTYAGNRRTLADVESHPRFHFERVDIADAPAVEAVWRAVAPNAVVNFAAETHVDRSIEGPAEFVRTNVVGTLTLLETARRAGERLSEADRARFRFLQISTDEVYGALGPEGAFTETTPYAPNSPYAASKASADHLVRAYQATYGLPTLVTHCSNNYGPYQFPEKLIPLMILNAVEGKPLPIYGDGGHVRDWIYVEDHCEGVLAALLRGRVGERYNIGSENECTNRAMVDRLCAILEEVLPAARNPALADRGVARYTDLRAFVEDRPGHDRRYAIDATKIHRDLGWRPGHDLESGLAHTVRWYLENRDWCETVSQVYRRERLGLVRGVDDEAARRGRA